MFGKLNFDSEFEEFLSINSNDKVAMLIGGGGSNIINFIGDWVKKEGDDMVSYLPKSRLDKITSQDPYEVPGRVHIRIGRFANKFLRRSSFIDFNISPSDIESFVNVYKSYFMRNDVVFKIIEGIEILKYYHYSAYFKINESENGTLWNSCMRQEERNKYMKLYSDNPDKIKLLVLLTKDGQLLGRSLLWVNILDDVNTYNIMDRIYTYYEHDFNLFKNWAKDNGYSHKMEQSSRSESHFISYINGNPEVRRLSLSIKLNNHIQNYYPYLDTFKFYNIHTGNFSNSDDFRYQYVLVQSDGSLEKEPESENTEDEESVFETDY